jgi:hypothetical protein
MLKGKQKKLDKNKDGKISGEDFKIMSPKKAALGALMIGKAMKKKDKAMPVGLGAALAKKDMLKKMTKAKEGKSVKTFEELQKFGVTTKKSPEKNSFQKDINRQLRRAEATQKLSRRGVLSDRERKDLQDGIYPKDLSKLKGAVSEKELSRLQNLADKKSKGGVTKAKYGKMMKASEGSMTSSEGPTNKVRGTGIAVRGTNFKGVF